MNTSLVLLRSTTSSSSIRIGSRKIDTNSVIFDTKIRVGAKTWEGSKKVYVPARVVSFV